MPYSCFQITVVIKAKYGMQKVLHTPAGDASSIEDLGRMLEDMIVGERSREAVAMMLEVFLHQQKQISDLSLRLSKQLRMAFGQRSEMVSANQLALFLDILGAQDDEESGEIDQTSADKTGDKE